MKYILAYSITLEQCKEQEISIEIPVENSDTPYVFFRRTNHAPRAPLSYCIQKL